MKVLVTGASGIVGRYLVNLLSESNIDVIQTYNSRKIESGHCINFLDEKIVDDFIQITQPTVCVNCIVQRFTDVCELNWNETKKVNIDIPSILSRICNKYSVKFIHISTDYVFDGKSPPYYPESPVNPLQNYGISKLISEKRVLSNNSKSIIIRVPVLYCDSINSLDETAVTVIGKKVLNQVENTKEDDYSLRRPVYIPDFCKFIMDCIIEKDNGIFHFYNQYDSFTKFYIANKIGEILDLPIHHIYPAGSLECGTADRPYDTQLIDKKYDINKYNFTPLSDGLLKAFSFLRHPSFSDKNSLNDIFFLFDLDGTLIDTEWLHFNSYEKAFNDIGISFSNEDFNKLLNENKYPNYAKEYDLNTVKKSKNNYLQSYNGKLEWIIGAEEFIQYLTDNNANIVVVTNTTKENVYYFKTKFPLLNKITQWITRDNYTHAKPSKEPYELAIKHYKKKERYIVGFENTLQGVQSLQGVTKIIYCLTNIHNSEYKKLKKEDIYLLKDFNLFINKLKHNTLL